ncbi:MAG: hypothetical protein WC830_06940 [Burkholderiales bacterium]|jgi:hypothetical protein
MFFDHFYMTGLGMMAYGVIYLPFALFASWLVYRWILRQLPMVWLRRLLVVVSAGAIVTAPLWDVYAIGREAEQLCNEQAGLHIYRTVEAEGFLGSGMSKYWADRGFKYVESGGSQNRKFRGTMRNETVVIQEVEEFASQYQVGSGEDHTPIGKHMARSSYRVVDRQNGEVLGELIYFSIYPSWLDNLFIGLTGTGSGFSPWLCGNESQRGARDRLGPEDVVLGTIKPRKAIVGESK